ncbi:Rieske (2Fe-2S) protein [Pleurocapsales cyanobacterium LEGE 10410]|nr:Rieske (2Fe-2S) protein [Pleurocapsales cyanobacterium LEGE 10410]
MKRRKFFNWVGVGLLASYFPVALAACSAGEDSTTATTEANPSAGDLLSLGTTAELQSAGYLLNEESEVIVVQDSEGQLIALNPICTHQGCVVQWQEASNTLVCPCHNAKYAPDGEVLAKPATAPLSSYEVKEENGEILVKVS